MAGTEMIGVVYGNSDRRIRRVVRAATPAALEIAITVRPDEGVIRMVASNYDLQSNVAGSLGLLG